MRYRVRGSNPLSYRAGLAAFMPVGGVAALKNVNFETDSKTGDTLICYNSEQLTSSPLKELRTPFPAKAHFGRRQGMASRL